MHLVFAHLRDELVDNGLGQVPAVVDVLLAPFTDAVHGGRPGRVPVDCWAQAGCSRRTVLASRLIWERQTCTRDLQ